MCTEVFGQFSPDNDFSKFGIAYFVIGIAFKDEIILDVVNDNCSQ